MKLAKSGLLIALPLATSAFAQPPRPATPRPCVLMPRSAPVATPAAVPPRDRCAVVAGFPRR